MLVHAHDDEQMQSPSRITSSPSLSPQPTQPSPLPKPIQPIHEKLEYKLKSGKARRKEKIVLSDDEEIAEDSSKQGTKISQIDEDLTISLVTKMKYFLDSTEKMKFMRSPSEKLKHLYKKRLPLKLLKNMEVVRKVRWRLGLLTYKLVLLVLQRKKKKESDLYAEQKQDLQEEEEEKGKSGSS
ncbi:hypothetical protein Tco_0571655 [Tanacetum coccineum]